MRLLGVTISLLVKEVTIDVGTLYQMYVRNDIHTEYYDCRLVTGKISTGASAGGRSYSHEPLMATSARYCSLGTCFASCGSP